MCVLSGVIATVPLFKHSADNEDRGTSGGKMAAMVITLVGAVVVSIFLVAGVSGPNWAAVAWGRNSATFMATQYPAILGKNVPLTADESAVIEDAINLELPFKTLGVTMITPEDDKPSHYELYYTLDALAKADAVEKTNAWIKTNEKLLTAALAKKAQFTDEYEAVKTAYSLGLRDLTLKDGKLVHDPMSAPLSD